eukprot:TRINITY_DN1748_c0_g1_i1.p2 TRINITY_DN1748_c0_g1~~TRINITY_DN1748_c0_g1_i1.p2  ORF type:complete len:203 (-),score=86.87 TRINITY_DN1748_c0_g1_i1:85-693(-)
MAKKGAKKPAAEEAKVEEVTEEDPKVEEVEADDDDSDSDEEVPKLEGADEKDQERAKQNRAEKKSRKAIAKLGLKPVEGINRVAIRKGRNILFVIAKPDVFKAPASETYVVFGEAKVEDLSAQAQANAAQQFAAPQAADSAAEAASAKVEDAEEGEVDETGIEAKDIDLVMSQVSCTRGKAVAALRANNNDIVEAIMHLSSS